MLIELYTTHYLTPDQYKDCNFFDQIDILDSYKFYSSGINGLFELRIIITKRKGDPHQHRYNLGFGKWDSANLDIDDLFKTKNGDVDKILATVASKAVDFLKKFPKAEIGAKGSTDARTRLYQKSIAKNFEFIPSSLRIDGIIIKDNYGWREFEKGKNYDAFLLSAK